MVPEREREGVGGNGRDLDRMDELLFRDQPKRRPAHLVSVGSHGTLIGNHPAHTRTPTLALAKAQLLLGEAPCSHNEVISIEKILEATYL